MGRGEVKVEVGEVKKKLMKLLEKVAEDLARENADSVAIYIKWECGEPKEIEWELYAGVCECGEWAVFCRGCLDTAYERGKEEGRRECEMY